MEHDGQSMGIDRAGWRDELRDLIGDEVRDFLFFNDASPRLVISFANDTDLVVSLAASERGGPEAVHYVPGDNEGIEVW